MMAQGALGEAGKGAYNALKTALAKWAGHDASKVEAKPDSDMRKAALAEEIDERNDDEKIDLAELAKALVAEVRKEKEARGPVGAEIGTLSAMEVQLGTITARRGTGFKADRVDTKGTFRIEKIETGADKPGKQ